MFENQVKSVVGSHQIKETGPISWDSTVSYAQTGWYQSTSSFRFAGPRESFKFQLMAQNLQSLTQWIVPKSEVIVSQRDNITGNLIPSDDDLAELQHLRSQVEFQEYLQLRAANRIWL